MRDEPLDRDAVLGLLQQTIHALQRDEQPVRASACDALGVGSAEWSACRDKAVSELQDAEEWAERENAIQAQIGDAPPTDSPAGAEYLPSHPTLAVFQSAMDEEIEHGQHRLNGHDPRWLTTILYRLRTRFTGNAPFVEHRSSDDFREPLPARCRVALVSDWGTGNEHSAAVARQIRAADPDHVIHLGDVYYSGTPREMADHFTEMWEEHGPAGARYWALNGNHDMYCGGLGYFGHLLPSIGQPASYFALGNEHWQLVALDTAYVGHNLTRPQVDWTDAQLAGPARSILLTHHHLVSPFRKPGYRLDDWLRPFMSDGRLYGWIWGHDHHLIEFADILGVKCRCIGHGGVPHVVPPAQFRHPAEVVRIERRSAPGDPGHGISGFAMLTFDGPRLDIDYLDEAGGTSWSETWRA
jgi:hypothetical protein